MTTTTITVDPERNMVTGWQETHPDMASGGPGGWYRPTSITTTYDITTTMSTVDPDWTMKIPTTGTPTTTSTTTVAAVSQSDSWYNWGTQNAADAVTTVANISCYYIGLFC